MVPKDRFSPQPGMDAVKQQFEEWQGKSPGSARTPEVAMERESLRCRYRAPVAKNFPIPE